MFSDELSKIETIYTSRNGSRAIHDIQPQATDITAFNTHSLLGVKHAYLLVSLHRDQGIRITNPTSPLSPNNGSLLLIVPLKLLVHIHMKIHV